jgi:hypothetical protein
MTSSLTKLAAGLILGLCIALATPLAHARAEIRDVYVIHFIIDGTNLSAFNRALDEGRMPTIKERFVDEGAVFDEGLSTFPSTSTSVYQAYASGLWPGHAGIPHLERFDRERRKVIGYLTISGHAMINTDLINLRALMNPDVAQLDPPTTLFERLGGWPTASIYSSFSRGASEHYPKVAPIGALWHTYVSEEQESVNVIALRRVMKLFQRKPDAIPRYTLVGLYSTDIMGHKYGPQSEEVQEVLEQFDVFLKDFFSLLDEQGIGDKTFIVITADHGMHDTGKLFMLRAALRKRGWVLKSSPPPNSDYVITAASRGVVSSHAYVKHDGGFEPIKDPDLLKSVPLNDGAPADLAQFIRNLEATDLIIARAGQRRARIFDRDGRWADAECYIVSSVEHCAYIVGTGDPVGYASDPRTKMLADGKPHSTLAWKKASADSTYPDAVVGFSQIFHDGRAGDVFITTRGPYGFRKVKHGNHGGPGREDMRTPILMRGPSVPKGHFGAARPMDVFALAASWLGLDVSAKDHDGTIPFDDPTGEDETLATLAALDQSFDATSLASSKRSRLPVGFKRKSARELAQVEAGNRRELSVKLKTLLTELERRNADGTADKRYAKDHIAIVQRAIDETEEGHARMLQIVKVLGGKD